MKKMSEHLKEMNFALEVLNNTRINDFGKFHETVEKLIKPFLPLGLAYSAWEVYMLEGLREKIFVLHFDFTDDKRVKVYNRRGRLHRCWFEQIVKGETFQELKNQIVETKRDRELEWLQKAIIEKKKEVEELEIRYNSVLNEKKS